MANHNRHIKVLQFGQGNFLRAFADLFIQNLNDNTDFHGSVVIVKPTDRGNLDKFRAQDNKYHVIKQGLVSGKPVQQVTRIDSIIDCLNPYDEFDKYLEYAHYDTLRVIISNTTEAGIAFDSGDKQANMPATSYPGKLTQFLYERFRFFDKPEDKGLIILPCELIDKNADALLECVLQYAKLWELGEKFVHWITNSCHFCNTLVDCIVSGYPKSDIDKYEELVGEKDELLTICEPYALWVIEECEGLKEFLHLDEINLPVMLVDSCDLYKKRKVRILNGAHTALAMTGLLYQKSTVCEAMEDASLNKYIKTLIYDEVIPSLDMDKAELVSFADAVISRFLNPYLHHQLASIALNSISKWRTRCLPTVLEYHEKFGKYPANMTASLAALIRFYQCFTINDSKEVQAFFADLNHQNLRHADYICRVIGTEQFWGINLNHMPGFAEDVLAAYQSLCNSVPNKVIKVHPSDNVAVALQPLTADEAVVVSGRVITLRNDIPAGHKFALAGISQGAQIIKYGYSIGYAASDISTGEHVHTHNTKTGLSDSSEFKFSGAIDEAKYYTLCEPNKCFMGYKRKDGNVGVRNEIWIIPTVGCVNKVAEQIKTLAKARYPQISFSAFTHPYGCSQLGDDQDNTRKILADLCTHPNAGGVLLLGLGCENSGVEEVLQFVDNPADYNIKTLVAQTVSDEIEASMEILDSLVESIKDLKREKCQISDLTIGVKCGGSDGLSGLTANPLVGRISDFVVNNGGKVIMGEVPEMFGAENYLFSKCASEEVFAKASDMVSSFRKYFSSLGFPVSENPSPGNIAGGITTLEDKSLGCVQKAGSSIIQDILSYGDKVKTDGLSLISTPGNDLVATTALAAAGAQIVLFTTGRGTPFSGPVPTLKISSNTQLAERKSNWIDFDAESSITDPAERAEALIEMIIKTASGEHTLSEALGYQEIAIFKQGITL